MHYGVNLHPFKGSFGGPLWKSALQLGIGGPVLKPCVLPTTLIGGLCAFAGGIEATTVVASNVINIKDIATKPATVEFLFQNFIATDYYDPFIKHMVTIIV